MATDTTRGKILFIDAYDSFSENIAALLSQILSVRVTMIHIDTRVEELFDDSIEPDEKNFTHFIQQFDALVLGPGPGNPTNPSDSGLFREVWNLSRSWTRPVLGICLGFQSLCTAFGAGISRLAEPCHGHARKVEHCQDDIFVGVGEVIATNYNSLQVRLDTSEQPPEKANYMTPPLSPESDDSESSQDETRSSRPDTKFSQSKGGPDLLPLAWDEHGTLMAARHTSLPYWGLQFHPESCKSNNACHDVIRNWWKESRRWSTSVIPRRLIPRSRLAPGHVWSRPLTPVQNMNLDDTSMNTSDSIHETMRNLTARSSATACRHSWKPPVSSHAIADLCRSMSSKDCAMLESSRKGRYNIYAMPHSDTWRIEYCLHSSTCTIYRSNEIITEQKTKLSHFLDDIHKIIADRAINNTTTLPFSGGFIGYLSYEVGLANLGVRSENSDAGEDETDISFLWVDRSIIIDHDLKEVHVQSIRADDSTWTMEMVSRINSLSPTNASQSQREQRRPLLSPAEIHLPDEETYKKQISTCKSYLHAGDSYELCLTTSALITFPPSSNTTSPFTSYALYRNLTTHNPVPFSAYLSLGTTRILSSSPEQFLTFTPHTNSIDMKPMKGTVSKFLPSSSLNNNKPGKISLATAHQILSTPKESAENLMIADLIRHDLHATVGWHPGAVRVLKLCEVEEHETLYQLVSHICAVPLIPPTLSAPERARVFTGYGHKALLQPSPRDL